METRARASIILAALFLAGCFPYATTYQQPRIAVEGATYGGIECARYGPPVLADRANDGALQTLDRREGRALYRFAFVPLPAVPDGGSIELPRLVVSGAPQPGPVIHFERRPFGAFMPLNC